MQRIAVHDLKNPLQAIIGSADLICRKNPELPASVRLAKGIFEASKRMLALLNNMLEISRIETDDLKLELQAVDIGGLVSLAAEGFANQMLNKEQKLDLKIESGCL
ncbi:MAG: hypothetical protein NTW95_06845, partial [Candidatus Aminicenantes bacterium]|nr:hypothetical protein [Candidatus Aminicenantes bacterium]